MNAMHLYQTLIEWYWQRKTEVLREKQTEPSSNLSTTNPISAGLRSIPGPRGERFIKVTDRHTKNKQAAHQNQLPNNYKSLASVLMFLWPYRRKWGTNTTLSILHTRTRQKQNLVTSLEMKFSSILWQTLKFKNKIRNSVVQ